MSNIPVYLRSAMQDGGLPLQRKDTYVLKLMIDTGGSNVTVSLSTEAGIVQVGIISANGLQEVFIPLAKTLVYLKKKFGLIIDGLAGVANFQLNEWYIDYDVRPMPLPYLRLPPDNWGVSGRKRIPDLTYKIDTLNSPVTLSPILDGVQFPSQTVTSNDNLTVQYNFSVETYAKDIGCIIQAAANQYFEYYDTIKPRQVEVLPDEVQFLRIPSTNLGTISRKRIITFAFVINTFGKNVLFVPYVDGVALPSQSYSTTDKTTVLYTFVSEVIGTDIWGTLDGQGQYFEYYGVNLDECISEKMPPRASYYVIPNTNFGIAAKKRIRTIPLVINTFNHLIKFTPVVDTVPMVGASQIFSTPVKQTILYLFTSDVFGIDYGGLIDGQGKQFEFYQMLQPEDVETLPVGKVFDQIGPLEMERSGKLLEFWLRVIATNNITYNIYLNDVLVPIANNVIQVMPLQENSYRVKLPQGLIGQVTRIEFSSTAIFYRFNCKVKFNIGGSGSDAKVVTIK